MHLPGLNPENIEEIKNACRNPEGTFEFDYYTDELFKDFSTTYILLEIPTGSILLRLERDEENNLIFIHSSPGTYTRIAKVNLNEVIDCKEIHIVLRWHPEDIILDIFADNGKLHLKAEGDVSDRRFMVDESGNVQQFGIEGIPVRNVRYHLMGEVMLSPTAIETWNSTIEACKTLLNRTPSDDYIYECICSNLVIIMLITGFETYCKSRFLELEGEGVNPDFNKLVAKFLSQEERKRNVDQAIVLEASTEGISPTKKLVNQKRIDFQNYDRCKKAYNKGYGIKFGELNITHSHLEEIQRLIRFRHRLVHVSPSISMLNQDRVPPEEPIFSKKEYSLSAIEILQTFIQELHNRSLQLR